MRRYSLFLQALKDQFYIFPHFLLPVNTFQEIKQIGDGVVIVIFMCECDWATGCPDIWSNNILVYLWGCFWMRLMFESLGWESRVPSPVWVGLIRLGEDLTRRERLSKKELLLLWLFELGHWSFPAFKLELKRWLFLGLQPARFQTGTYAMCALVLRPLDWNYTSGVLSLHLANCRSWDFSASIILWVNFL